MGITTFRIKSQIGHLFGSRHGTMAWNSLHTKDLIRDIIWSDHTLLCNLVTEYDRRVSSLYKTK